MMILTRSLDPAARNSHQNAHVPKLVAALEPQPPPGPQTIRLNRCLPISQGFYAPAKERQGLELLVVRGVNTKDRCEACDIAKGEATLYYHKGLRRTLWSRDVNYYKRNSHLASKDIFCGWRLADHCESCGTTEGRLCQLHDLRITVCRREYDTYRRNGRLAPLPTNRTWPKADHCESCGTTEERLRRHRDSDPRMTLCEREDIYHYKTGRLQPIPRELWPMADHFESRGTTILERSSIGAAAIPKALIETAV